jgi:hypothetical protein
MRQISPSRSPIDDRPEPIQKMRLAASLLGHYRHLNRTDSSDLPLPSNDQLIETILGVLPQLHTQQPTTPV